MNTQQVIDLFTEAWWEPSVETVEAALSGASEAQKGMEKAERMEMKARCAGVWGLEPVVLEKYMLTKNGEKWIHDLSVQIMVLCLKKGVEVRG